jgi:hypothetical protein
MEFDECRFILQGDCLWRQEPFGVLCEVVAGIGALDGFVARRLMGFPISSVISSAYESWRSSRRSPMRRTTCARFSIGVRRHSRAADSAWESRASSSGDDNAVNLRTCCPVAGSMEAIGTVVNRES